METNLLLQRSNELLAKVEPKLKRRDYAFVDPDGQAIYRDLRACDRDLVRIGADCTHRSVTWVVDEIRHRRRALRRTVVSL